MNRVWPFQMAILSACSALLSVMVNTPNNASFSQSEFAKRGTYRDGPFPKKKKWCLECVDTHSLSYLIHHGGHRERL